MSESYTFVEATPVKRAAREGAGRRREPNPFHEAVSAIVGQVNSNGEPLARSAPFTLDAANGETLKQRTARIRRFLTRAGKEVAKDGQDPYSIAMVISEGAEPSSYTVTFWDRNAG